jgi:hypothetical protein
MRSKLCLGLAAAASAAWLLRRQGKRWGATGDEVHRSLAGDDLVPRPMVETTHAVTIHAPAAAIWPWLVQMGYHRAGWYTDSWFYWVDKYYFRAERPPSPVHLLPQFQHLEVGDTVPDGPPGTAFFTVAQLEPQRSLALLSTTHIVLMAPRPVRCNPRFGLYGKFSWVFVLDEQTEGVTRLIVRMRASLGPRLFRMFFLPLFYPSDFLIVRLMLRTIRQRAEQGSGSHQATEQVEATNLRVPGNRGEPGRVVTWHRHGA